MKMFSRSLGPHLCVPPLQAAGRAAWNKEMTSVIHLALGMALEKQDGTRGRASPCATFWDLLSAGMKAWAAQSFRSREIPRRTIPGGKQHIRKGKADIHHSSQQPLYTTKYPTSLFNCSWGLHQPFEGLCSYMTWLISTSEPWISGLWTSGPRHNRTKLLWTLARCLFKCKSCAQIHVYFFFFSSITPTPEDNICIGKQCANKANNCSPLRLGLLNVAHPSSRDTYPHNPEQPSC